MARDKTLYTCRECGGTSPKWLGKCPHCNAWNTLDEIVPEPAAAAGAAGRNTRFQALARSQPVATLADIEAAEVVVIEDFLPAQLSEEDAVAAIKAIVAELGAASLKDMGRVMAAVKERHGSELDMSKASGWVKAALG